MHVRCWWICSRNTTRPASMAPQQSWFKVVLYLILTVILFIVCVSHDRGLHQKLQRSVQPLAETLGGRRGQEKRSGGHQASGRTPALTATPPHHRTDHFLLPALCHGPPKGEKTLPIPNQLMLNGSRIHKPLKLHLIYRIPVTLNPLLQDVLLFYYTQWCGFCSVLNHVIIQLARLLQGKGTITVARCGVCMFDCWCTQYFVFLIMFKFQSKKSF